MLNTKNKISTEQMHIALNDIAHMASAMERLCHEIQQGDNDGYLTFAAGHLAAKIGWTADRCLVFDNQESDRWLMSPAWNDIADELKKQSRITS